jgi:hypothetical protein
MRTPDSVASEYTARAMATLQRINGTTDPTSLTALDMTLPKTGNSAIDAKKRARCADGSSRSKPVNGSIPIVQAANGGGNGSGNLFDRAKQLGIDTARTRDTVQNAFTQPGALPASTARIETYDVKNKDGTTSTYRKPASMVDADKPSAPIVAGRPAYQIGDLERGMNAQTMSQWGPLAC